MVRAHAAPIFPWAFNFVALWVAALLLSGIDYDGIWVLIVAGPRVQRGPTSSCAR